MRAVTIMKCFILLVILVMIKGLYNFVYNQNESNFQELRDVNKMLEHSTTKQSNEQPKSRDTKRKIIGVINIGDITKKCSANILFMVTSHSIKADRRQSIRKNWGNESRFATKFKNITYKVFFLTGLPKDLTQINEESKLYGDVFITNHTESYSDTSRVMLGMDWSMKNCKYDYYVKTDDDVFINIPNLIKLIYHDPFSKAHQNTLYAGQLSYAIPQRNVRSKWFISEKEWAPKLYPPFVPGAGCILSYNIVKAIRPFFDWKNPFKFEDVYIGHLIFFARIQNLGYRKPKYKEFFLYADPVKCSYQNMIVVQHPVRSEECMRKLTENSLKLELNNHNKNSLILLSILSG